MRRYLPLKKYLVNKLHRNEAIWKTKKAQKAQLMISMTIATMLSLQLLISVANAKPMILTFENEPLHLGDRALTKVPSSDPLTEVVSEGGYDTQVSVEAKIAKAFPENKEIMIAIAKAESGLNNKAVNHNRNGSVDKCIFQVNSIHNYDNLDNEDNCIKAARSIYDRQGLIAWSAYNNGSYLKHLGR